MAKYYTSQQFWISSGCYPYCTLEIDSSGVYVTLTGVSGLKSVSIYYSGTTETISATDSAGTISISRIRIGSPVNGTTSISISGTLLDGSSAYFYGNKNTSSTFTSWTIIAELQNAAPTVSLSVPTIYAGTTAEITWSTSDSDGDTVTTTSLMRHYKASGASSYESTPLSVSGSARSYSDSIPASYADGLIYYTVTVSDGYTTKSTDSSAKTVISNRVPTISGSDGNLGEFALTAPTYSYSVSDPDGGTVSVTETIDGVIHRDFTATLEQQYTVEFDDTQWLTTLNGDHTITITATDPKGASATRTMTFTKNVTSFSFTLATPLDADDMITKCAETLTASIPEGAYIKIEVCNNGYDDEPTWEDVTQMVLNREKIFIGNDTKTADKWGYNIRVTVNRLEATGECWAFSTTGYFE